VQVHYDEGVATHIGPESCAGGREAVREALTGVRIGQPLSRERLYPGCRLSSGGGRQHGVTRHASVRPARRHGGAMLRMDVVDPGMYGSSLFHGNREISCSTPDGSPFGVRVGKAKVEADDARAGEVRPRCSSWEADEQYGAIRGGAGGAPWRSHASHGRRGPREMRKRPTRAGRRVGKACHQGSTVYGKQQGKGKRRSLPRSCTTSPSNCSRHRSTK
jgi:hypothetical protein